MLPSGNLAGEAAIKTLLLNGEACSYLRCNQVNDPQKMKPMLVPELKRQT